MTNPNEIGCTVLIDGHPINDGCTSTDPDVPTVLSGLKIQWGRTSTVDQPQPSTCVFHVDDPLYGERMVPTLTIGRQIDVRIDTVIYPDPTEGTIPDLILSGVSASAGWKVAADGQTAAIMADGTGRRVGFYLTPLPFSADPFAWDTVPRSLPGQDWRFHITITPPAPFAGYAGWRAEVTPAYFTNPNGSDVQAPGPWIPCNTTADVTFTPPGGVWLGLAVHLYPTGPAWNQLDATTWDGAVLPLDPPPAGGYKITAFGDSITSGTWLPTYADSWIPKLAARLGVPITNKAVGGAPLHDWATGPVLLDQVTAALAAGQPTFNTAIILCGTNDLMTHDSTTVISHSAAAAQVVQNTLTAKGVRVIWLGVLPMGSGTSHTDAQLPTLLDRRKVLNNALKTMAGAWHWYDTDRLFGADAMGWVRDPSWLLDGLHPTPKGATQLADEFPEEVLVPGSTGYHPTWNELATFTLSGFEMLAPTSGAAGSALVFSGRITDIHTSWDGGDTADVEVIAQDWLAELTNRYIGDQPWNKEALSTRAQRIVSLSGQPIKLVTDPGVGPLLVSYRDVDRQPATSLLQQLATTCGGVLWTATHLVTGQIMRIEDVGARPAALTLSDAGGVVHIVPSPAALGHALPVSACDIDVDPVRFALDMTDTVSIVAVQWLEQTVDTDNPSIIKPTQRTIEVVAPETAAVIGARRLSVSTQLTTEPEASAQAVEWLARSSVMAWRIEGLRWDTTGDLGPDEITSIVTLLDGSRRNGLPIALTELPDWATVMTRGNEVALYVEGGTYTYNAGSWVLELDTSSATGSASGELPWNSLDTGWAWNEFDPAMSWLDLYGVTYPAI